MQSYSSTGYALPGNSPPHHVRPRDESQDRDGDDDETGKKKKSSKRRKVNHACLYCRRSHMTCDDGRPCQRCIKREIGHLCHDERRPQGSKTPKDEAPTMGMPNMNVDLTRGFQPNPTNYPISIQPTPTVTTPQWPMSNPQTPFFFGNETLGNEFSVLSDFLENLDDRSFFNPAPSSLPTPQPMIIQDDLQQQLQDLSSPEQQQHQPPQQATISELPHPEAARSDEHSIPSPEQDKKEQKTTVSTDKEPSTAPVILPAATKTERFLLTAADQESGSRDERLNRVIQAKYEAGLLKPYNYVKGYARLSRWMDRNVSQDSKQQILQPLSVLRPKFRAVAQSLTDIDLVFIEEAFERLLLDYDRVFSAMGIPACLWRRTGEIYKGNREFAELVGVDEYMMRDGRLCIYELMAEESAVNYWEKYGQVAFDSHQKAILTSCVLRFRPVLSTSTTSGPGTPRTLARRALPSQNSQLQQGSTQNQVRNEEGCISCCFSFTIRRDMWGIPSMIVGNFIKC
ncbi:hypothetical protein BD410DRAFT_784195 [Rickenella mellea]|uniref:Zn(2)-C6 fungal-type domain-containing protein n=1 Tax=Rickenella mellea TaxID=50990 RepID=A0A4Y7QH08_9AGAM|nr:hypothetical protein BD410DRAFT_784195 [Rickenella mellea]